MSRRIPRNRPIYAQKRIAPTTNGQSFAGTERRFQGLIANTMNMSRYALANRLMDSRRDINDECGYPKTGALTPQHYRELYERNPVAARVVEVLPAECWQSQPTVYEVEDEDRTTPFEAAWEQLGRDLSGQGWHQEEEGNSIWEYLCRADMLAGIGSFGVVLMGFNDGKPLSEPVDGIDPITGKALNKKDKVELTFLDEEGNEVSEDDLLAKEAEAVETEGGLKPGQTPEAGANPEEGVKDAKSKDQNHKGPVTEEEDEEEDVPSLIKKLKPTANLEFGEKEEDEEKEQPVEEGEEEEEQSALPRRPLDGTDAQYDEPFGIVQGVEDEEEGEGLKLLFVRLFDESLVQITRYEQDPRSPRYGQPVMYLITMNDPRDQSQGGAGLQTTSVNVHWTRCVHVSDNRKSSEVFGVPRMRTPLNRLLDLDKLYGGSAEMYYRGAFPGYSLETHPQMGGDVDIDEDALKDKMEQYMNGLQRYMWSSGMSMKPLSPQVVDPSPQITSQIEAICILIGVPMRIFMGSERGELASSQDSDTWNDRLRKRQRTFITPRIIVPFVDRLIAVGVLPQPTGYSVDWPDMDALSEGEKATVAKTKTEAMSAYVGGGVEAMMAPVDYYTRILGFTREEAEAVIENAAEAEPLDTGEPAMGFDEEGNPVQLDPVTGQPMGGGAPPFGKEEEEEGGEEKPPGSAPPPFPPKKSKGPPKPPTTNDLVDNNCGTGGGGFKPGNTCARGGKSKGGSGGGGDSVDLSNTPLFRATNSDSKEIKEASGGYTALGNGVYLSQDADAVKGYGKNLHTFRVSPGEIRVVKGDAEMDVIRADAKKVADDQLKEHFAKVSDGSEKIDPELITKLASPSEQIRTYLESKGYIGLSYEQVDKVNDHHSQVLVFRPESLEVLTINNCGTGGGGFKPGNTCAKGGKGGGGVAKYKAAQKKYFAAQKVMSKTFDQEQVSKAMDEMSDAVLEMEEAAEEVKAEFPNGSEAVDKLQQAKKEAIKEFDGEDDADVGDMLSGPEVSKGVKAEEVPQKTFTPAALPSSLESVMEVKTLGGSTGAKLYKDDDGNEFVVKYGNHQEHIAEEAFANQMYRAAGVDVPATTLVLGEGGKVAQIAQFVEGKTLGQLKGKERQDAEKKIRENFAVDALFANWDVVGMSKDNILVGNDGKVYRIDNGGSLRYRAQGAAKGSAFGDKVGELETMRQQGSASPVFKDMADFEVANQIHALSAKKQAILNATPDSLKPTMEKRFAYMEEWAAKKTGKPLPTATPSTPTAFQASKTVSAAAKLGFDLTDSSSVGGAKISSKIHENKGDVKYTALQLANIQHLNPNGPENGVLKVQKNLKPEQYAHIESLYPGVTVKGVIVKKEIIKKAHLTVAKATSKPDAVGVIDGALGTIKTPTGTFNLEDVTAVTPKGKKLIGAKTLPGTGTGLANPGTISLVHGEVPMKTSSKKASQTKALKEWGNSLSPPEADAVGRWTNGMYSDMRKRIGTGKLTQEDKDLLSALEKAPTFQGTVYRGLPGYNVEDFGTQLSQSLVSAGIGAIWTDPAPMSLSRTPNEAAKRASNGGIMLRVKSKTCRMMENMSLFKEELEVMGTGQQKFRVTGVAKNVKISTGSKTRTIGTLVDLEEID